MNWKYYISIAEFTIVVYDYFLTLGAEIERYWGSRTTFTTTLFYVNRYSIILGLIPQILFDFWPEPILHIRGCMALAIYRWGYIFLIILIIDLTFIVRLYVIYEYHKWIAIPLSVMKACVAGNSLLQLYLSKNLVAGTDYTSPVIYQNGCNQMTTRQQGLYMAYSWLGVVIFDLCIFGLTLWKTLRMRRYYALCGGIGTILMRDGAIYFGIVALINCANILFFILGSVNL
ncbi:hypothetical protein GGU11DRAFT_790133 [Lentinula aff. detonsa]|nr:hypothetical protein GGU11DRAFT_790133 [Lentinula aff. detonsa]